jgi:WD40 repeat protein
VEQSIKAQPIVNSKNSKFQLIPSTQILHKKEIEAHNEAINTITFAKMNKYFLLSGGVDKCIKITQISQSDLNTTHVELLRCQGDITDIQITSNDDYFFASCVDNAIYVYKCDFVNRKFDLLDKIIKHGNIVTSIALDPLTERSFDGLNNGIKMASYVILNFIFHLGK